MIDANHVCPRFQGSCKTKCRVAVDGGGLGVDNEPRNGFERIAVSFRVIGNRRRRSSTRWSSAPERSAVYDIVTNGVPVAVEVSDPLVARARIRPVVGATLRPRVLTSGSEIRYAN